MQLVKALAMISVAALAASCHTTQQETAQTAGCPVAQSRNWTAYVNRMPGPDARPMLNVQGEIDLPTPGYRIELLAGRADRSATPVQQLALELTPPGGIVAQVIQTEMVRFQGPAIASRYRGVTIMCGGKALAEITEVSTVY